MRRINKLSKNKALALFLVTRRRTKVHREAKFVYSINRKNGIFTVYSHFCMF